VKEVVVPRWIGRRTSKGGRYTSHRVRSVQGPGLHVGAGHLAVLEQELARFTAAVAQGGNLPALVDAIKVREQRKRQLLGELAGLDGLQRVASLDVGQLQSELQTRLADWQCLLNRQVPVARQIIKKLLSGRIVFRQTEEGGYEFSGQASLGALRIQVVRHGRDPRVAHLSLSTEPPTTPTAP
jgi:hypothetical protein